MSYLIYHITVLLFPVPVGLWL